MNKPRNSSRRGGRYREDSEVIHSIDELRKRKAGKQLDDELRKSKTGEQLDKEEEPSEDLIAEIKEELHDLEKTSGEKVEAEEPREPLTEEEPSPVSRRRYTDPTKRQPARRVHKERTRIRWRLVSGGLGAAALLGAQGGLYWAEMSATWKALLEGAEDSVWVPYLSMGAMLLGAALVCAVITAVMDRSAIRSFFLGAGWCALLVLGMQGYHRLTPVEKEIPLALRMAQAALNPLIIAQQRLDEKLKEAQTRAADKTAQLKAELAEKTEEAEDLRHALERARQALKSSRDAGALKEENAEPAEP